MADLQTNWGDSAPEPPLQTIELQGIPFTLPYELTRKDN